MVFYERSSATFNISPTIYPHQEMMFMGKQQIKQKAPSFDRAFCFV